MRRRPKQSGGGPRSGQSLARRPAPKPIRTCQAPGDREEGDWYF